MSGYIRDSIITPEVVRKVDEYVETELADTLKFENRIPFDESGIFSLHLLAAQIFAKGYELGVEATEARRQGEHMRRFNAEKRAAK